MLTISAAGFVIFLAYLVTGMYVLRTVVHHTAGTAIGQGLGALIH